MMEAPYKRTQNKACLACSKRKVRCNIEGPGPCTACQKIGSDCVPNSKRARHASGSRPPTVEVIGGTGVQSSPIVSQLAVSPNDTVSSSAHRLSNSQLQSGVDALSSFVERGITSNDWDVFAGGEPVRIVYVGTCTSNLHQLVRHEQPERQTNHFPFPAIHDLLPWKPSVDQAIAAGISDSAHKELSSFPTKVVRDVLIDAYFEMVNPGYPVVNEYEFRQQYNDPDQPPPLLLFQAVLLVGAHVSDHPMISASRGMVTSCLFRRTKLLFDLRHENDRLFLVQAAVLMAWHTENSDSVSGNHYYWIGIACRIAFGLGMHRDLDEARVVCLMPSADRRIYRRVWWTLLQAEAFSALDQGRPSMIRLEDFDQAFLSEADFLEHEDTGPATTQKEFLQVNTQLALLALEVLQCHAPRAKKGKSSPSDILGPRLASIGLSLPAVHDFWACQLRINYNMILLTLYRKVPGAGVAQLEVEDAVVICSEAASDILTTFEAMAAQNTVRQCQFPSVSALMSATIQFSLDFQCALARGSFVRALGIHNQLQRLMGPAKQLSQHWPNAEPVARLCQRYCEECGTSLKHGIKPATTITANQPYLDVETSWQDIFAGFDTQGFDQYLQPSDWMNTSAPLEQVSSTS